MLTAADVRQTEGDVHGQHRKPTAQVDRPRDSPGCTEDRFNCTLSPFLGNYLISYVIHVIANILCQHFNDSKLL